MKWILIALISATGGWSINRWDQPAITTAAFDDRASCEAAAARMLVWEKDRHLDHVRVRTLCVPSSELSIK